VIDASAGGVTTIRYGDGSYRAGACNIGRREIALRRAAGIAGLAIAAILALVLVASGAPAGLRWLVFLPLFGGSVGLLQARRRFCVNYALRGRSNFGSPDETVTVVDAADRAADRRAAMRLILLAAGVSLVLSAVFVVLPV
jgi:hypothetical protein